MTEFMVMACAISTLLLIIYFVDIFRLDIEEYFDGRFDFVSVGWKAFVYRD